MFKKLLRLTFKLDLEVLGVKKEIYWATKLIESLSKKHSTYCLFY